MKSRRSEVQILLDMLLSTRIPATCTQIMFAVGLDWKNTNRYLDRATHLNLIERKKISRFISSSARLHRRQRGWSEEAINNVPLLTGNVWYKTTNKGEIFIKSYKALWEIADKHPAYQGRLPFDTVGVRNQTMKCPVETRFRNGFDREWATVPSNSVLYVEMQNRRRDVKIQAGFDGHSLDMQNMLDKRMDTIRLTLKQREYNANKKAAEVAASK